MSSHFTDDPHGLVMGQVLGADVFEGEIDEEAETPYSVVFFFDVFFHGRVSAGFTHATEGTRKGKGAGTSPSPDSVVDLPPEFIEYVQCIFCKRFHVLREEFQGVSMGEIVAECQIAF